MTRSKALPSLCGWGALVYHAVCVRRTIHACEWQYGDLGNRCKYIGRYHQQNCEHLVRLVATGNTTCCCAYSFDSTTLSQQIRRYLSVGIGRVSIPRLHTEYLGFSFPLHDACAQEPFQIHFRRSGAPTHRPHTSIGTHLRLNLSTGRGFVFLLAVSVKLLTRVLCSR